MCCVWWSRESLVTFTSSWRLTLFSSCWIIPGVSRSILCHFNWIYLKSSSHLELFFYLWIYSTNAWQLSVKCILSYHVYCITKFFREWGKESFRGFMVCEVTMQCDPPPNKSTNYHTKHWPCVKRIKLGLQNYCQNDNDLFLSILKSWWLITIVHHVR